MDGDLTHQRTSVFHGAFEGEERRKEEEGSGC